MPMHPIGALLMQVVLLEQNALPAARSNPKPMGIAHNVQLNTHPPPVRMCANAILLSSRVIKLTLSMLIVRCSPLDGLWSVIEEGAKESSLEELLFILQSSMENSFEYLSTSYHFSFRLLFTIYNSSSSS